MSVATKLSRGLTYGKGFPPIKTYDYLKQVIMRGHLTNLKYISTTKVPTTTKLDRVMKYNEKLPPIKSHDHFIRWSWEVTLQIK